MNRRLPSAGVIVLLLAILATCLIALYDLCR
jgi:hypothetical protein